MRKNDHVSPGRKAEKPLTEGDVDVVALGIVTAAILMFVATGSEIAPAVVQSLKGTGPGPQKFLLNAFLLNIAIIIFGWSRYRQLREELDARRDAEQKARQLAETDPLTGFLNRRSFNEAVDTLMDRSNERGTVVAMMMIDLDNFKQVNDYNGHHIGDQLLLEIAKRITGALPDGVIVGRIGGDEFAVALTCPRSRTDNVDQLAASLVSAIGEAATLNAVSIEVTASIGISRSDEDAAMLEAAPTSRDLLEMADIAMYHAKRQGRNGFYWFEPPMAEEMRFRSGLEAGIRRGIPAGEFVPYYEKQIDLESGEITGFEMLARWDSPVFGIVSPEVFIPIAEDIGAIADLSESVIAQALEDAKNWDPQLTLAVNISPLQLRDPWFAQKLLKLLIEAKFPPDRLEIEITESCLHENVSQVRTLISSLKNQGIRVSLDDFGTGYSSLAQLRSLPFDRIKIDRSFVTSVCENTDSAAIVHAIALLGRGLNLPITAEGIENPDVLERLRQYGPLKGQGYLYGRPQPAAAVRDLLARVEAGLADERIAAAPLARAATNG